MSSSSKPSSKWQLHSAFMQALYIEARHYRSLIEKEKPGIAPTLSLCRVAHHTGRLNTNYVLGKHKTDNESTSPLFISHCIILIFCLRNFPLNLNVNFQQTAHDFFQQTYTNPSALHQSTPEITSQKSNYHQTGLK